MGPRVCGYGEQVEAYGVQGVWTWGKGDHLWGKVRWVNIYGELQRWPSMGEKSRNTANAHSHLDQGVPVQR